MSFIHSSPCATLVSVPVCVQSGLVLSRVSHVRSDSVTDLSSKGLSTDVDKVRTCTMLEYG